MFEDRFGGEDIGGFGDGVEFGYMTDDDIAALGAVAEFEKADPDERDFVASVPIESRVSRKRAAEDTWWRAASSRRKLMDDVSERFRGPSADIDCIQAMFDDLGIILEPHKDGLRGQCPDDDHFSNSKKPFHVSSSGWCYCFACAQSKGADYRGQDAVSFFKEHVAGRLSPKEAYARLADIARIDVRDYSQDTMADERVREASRFADREGKYTWSDVKKINEIRAMPMSERQDFMRRQSIIAIRREIQRFYQAALHSPDQTLVEPVRRRLERATSDAAGVMAREREIRAGIAQVNREAARLTGNLAASIAELDKRYSSGEIDRDMRDDLVAKATQDNAVRLDRTEVALQSARESLREISGALGYHKAVISQATRALESAESAAARANEMAQQLVAMGIAHQTDKGIEIPAHIGYAPAVDNAAMHYLLSGSTSDGTRFSPSDVRCAGIGQMSTKRQRELCKTEDVLYDRLTFPVYSTKSGELVGLTGVRPEEAEVKYRYMTTRNATYPDGAPDSDPSVAFDWKSDVYNALNAAPSAQARGRLYVANNPLLVERLRAVGIDNVVSPARGGDDRGDGAVPLFHYKSHDETISQIAEAISDAVPVKVVGLSDEMAQRMCREATETRDEPSPVRAEIERALSQASAFGTAAPRPQMARGR